MRKRVRWMLAGGGLAALLAGCCLLGLSGRVVSSREGDLAEAQIFSFNTFHTLRAEACPGAAYTWKVLRRPDPWGDSNELEIRYPGGKTVRVGNWEGFRIDGKAFPVKVLSEGVVVRKDGSAALEPLPGGNPGAPSLIPETPVEGAAPPR